MWQYEDSSALRHVGVLGMKWGRRKASATSNLRPKSKRIEKKNQNYSELKKLKKERKEIELKNKKLEKENIEIKNTLSRKQPISKMSDSDLKALNSRLKMEQEYKTMVKSMTPEKTALAKKVLSSIAEESLKNIGTQLATNLLGDAVNAGVKKFAGIDSYINPKKGQK